ERVRRAQPLAAELTRHVHADAAGAEPGARRNRLADDRGVGARRAAVEEARRIIDVAARGEIVVEGVVHLAVDLEEADILLQDVAVDQSVEGAIGTLKIDSKID